MSYDIHDFDNSTDLQPCTSPQDDITLADGSVILPESIGKVCFNFEVNGRPNRIFLSGVRHCTKLDTKLISLGMLDKKSLTYYAHQGLLTVKDQNAVIMIGQPNRHNLYHVNLDADSSLPSQLAHAMTATISQSPADIATWHRRFVHLNQIYLKRLPSMTSGMKILTESADLLFCTVCVESKMTRQPHRDAYTPSDIPGYQINVDVGGSANAYVTWKSYRYFMLLVDDATQVTWVKLMKKKSDVLTVFCDFAVVLEKHYNIRVCIIHTNFGEFNSDAAAEYFSHTGLAWEPSIPNAQQQNGVVERHIRTVVEEARAKMIDTNFPIKLWAKSINTIVYIKNRSPASAVYEGTMTPIQDFHRGDPPNVDHIRIFGSETYVFNESDSQPGLTSKAWTGYLVGYGAQNQYRIYDPARNVVYVRRDIPFNEQVVGPPKPITTYDNFFHDKNTGDTAQIFLLLSGKTEQFTRFTPVDKNLTLYPASSAAPANFTPIQTPLQNDGDSSTLLHVPAIAHDMANTGTRFPLPTQDIPVPETPLPVPAIPDRSQVPGMFEDSDDDLRDALLFEKDDDSAHGAPCRSARTGANQVDYKKYFQKRKAATTKTNSSVPIVSPHSEASRILFDYALSQPEKQASCGFIRVAQNKAKVSTPDMLSLKNALK